MNVFPYQVCANYHGPENECLPGLSNLGIYLHAGTDDTSEHWALPKFFNSHKLGYTFHIDNVHRVHTQCQRYPIQNGV